LHRSAKTSASCSTVILVHLRLANSANHLGP
jgi:hypothetical protein